MSFSKGNNNKSRTVKNPMEGYARSRVLLGNGRSDIDFGP